MICSSVNRLRFIRPFPLRVADSTSDWWSFRGSRQWLIEKAAKDAETYTDKMWALRTKAWMEMQNLGYVPSNSSYLAAIVAYKDFNLSEQDVVVRSESAWSLVEWGEALAIVGDCAEAQKKKETATPLIDRVVYREDRQKIAYEMKELDDYLEHCKPGVPMPVKHDVMSGGVVESTDAAVPRRGGYVPNKE
jgi:hypothetical protein